MFVTGLSVESLIRREPALSDFDQSYETTFPDFINESKSIIDNRLRAQGYNLEMIGKKTEIFDFDNEAGTSIAETVTEPASGQLLLVFVATATKDVTLAVTGANGQTILSEALTLSGTPTAVILPYSDATSLTVTLTADTSISANGICAYLTDPAVFYLHLYKTLHLIYESMRSNPGDLFEQKSEMYRIIYEDEFATMVTFYDRNRDGVTDDKDGQGPVKRVRFER